MMTRCSICLLRHSEVDASWRGRIYGSLDAPLSERGREQSRAAAAGLAGIPFAAVISSGLERAEDTAAHLRTRIGPRSERIDDVRLREIDRGRWAGWNEAQVEADQPGGWGAFWGGGGLVIPPEGETLAQLQQRVVEALDEYAARFAPGPIAIVAHRWVLRVAGAHALGWPLEKCVRVEVPYAGMLVLDWPAEADARPPGLVLASARATRGWEAAVSSQPG